MAKAQNQKPPIQPVSSKSNNFLSGSITAKLALFLAILTFIVYANTLQNDYALDDFIVIKNNTLVTQGFSAIPTLLVTPYHLGHSIINNDLYRPLAMAVFAAEYQVFGGSPGGSHLINILVFAGCVILLFQFLNELFGEGKVLVSFIAALLFALHPIHTEVVANIKSQDELLCFLGSFSALLFFARFIRSGRVAQLALGAILFFLALLAKETAITLLAVVPLVFFFYLNDDKKKSIIITVCTFSVAGLYLLLRFSVLAKYNANHTGDVSFIDNILAGAPSISEKTGTAFAILGSYIRLLFVPYPLVCDYSYSSIPFVGIGSISSLLSMAAYIALAIAGFFLLFKTRKNPWAFTILFFLATIALFSNIPFLIGAAKAERFLFFASVGFCLAVALAIDKWMIKGAKQEIAVLKSGKILAILVPLCIIYAVITVARNSDWKTNTTLFTTDLPKLPENSRMHYYLGTDLLIATEAGANDAATRQQLAMDGISHLKKSVEIYPGFALVNSELGMAYFNLKNYDSSAVYYEKALTQNPRDTTAMHNLAGVYYFLQKYPESIIQCQKAIAIDPGYGRGYRNMGSCYMKMGKYDSAVYVFRQGMVVDPTSNAPYQNIAYSYKLLGNMDSARKYEAIAKQRNPAFSLDASAIR